MAVIAADAGRVWLRAFSGIWAMTLAVATLVAISRARLGAPVRHLLGLRLEADRNPPPDLGHVLALTAHNVPIAAWPLLLGVVGAHRDRRARSLADALLLACVLANIAPVGAALGAYGTRLLPYIPQLPLEWAGLALGATAWLIQRRRPLRVCEGVAVLALTTTVLLCAAVLETFAVPHRSRHGPLAAASMRARPVAGARSCGNAICADWDYACSGHSSKGQG